MAKNFNRQLFSKKLDLEILKKVMHTYKIKKLNQHVFSRGTLDEINILERLKDIKEELNQYYVPCKAKKYLEDIIKSRESEDGFRVEKAEVKLASLIEWMKILES